MEPRQRRNTSTNCKCFSSRVQKRQGVNWPESSVWQFGQWSRVTCMGSPQTGHWEGA